MDSKRWWIVGHDDKTWGPFEKARVATLASEGKLRADGLVCAEGESSWTAIDQAPELSDVPWPPRDRPATASQTPAPPAADARVRFNELDPIPPWATVLLSVPTLGLWGLFAFYRTLRLYLRLARAEPRTPTAEILFWVFAGYAAFVGLLVISTVGLAWPLVLPAVIVGAFLLREALRLRDAAIQRLVPTAATTPADYPPVKSDDWHFGLWITGSVLAIILVGIPILVIQALAWFEEHNRVAAIARGGFARAPAVAA